MPFRHFPARIQSESLRQGFEQNFEVGIDAGKKVEVARAFPANSEERHVEAGST